MKQAIGIAMMLVGAMMFHVASSTENPGSVKDVWKDIINTLSGVSNAPGTQGGVPIPAPNTSPTPSTQTNGTLPA